MAKQWSRYRVDPDKYNYHAGQTVDILWNVVESGCGRRPVTIQNTATASLYIYTPYQPNAAALAAYPGAGDSLLRLRQPQLLLHVPQVLRLHRRRRLDHAPSGGAVHRHRRSPSRTTRTCRRRSPARRSPRRTPRWPPAWPPGSPRSACPTSGAAAGPAPARTTAAPAAAATSTAAAATIGFDCSGLTAYVLGMAGYQIPGDSGSQRSAGTSDQLGRGAARRHRRLPRPRRDLPGHLRRPPVHPGGVLGRHADPHRAADPHRRRRPGAPLLDRPRGARAGRGRLLARSSGLRAGWPRRTPGGC